MKKFFAFFIFISILFVQSPVFAIERTDIFVEQKQIALKSKLKKEYNAYEYKITNNSKSHINIVNAQVLNGIDGNVGYNNVESGGGKSVGILWAICGPVGLITFGIGWAVGLIGTPIAWAVGNSKDKKAKKESIPYNNAVPLGILNEAETLSYMTLVPLGATPQLKLSIYDEKTKNYQSFIF